MYPTGSARTKWQGLRRSAATSNSRVQQSSARCEHVEDTRWIDRLLEPVACLDCQPDDRSIGTGLRAGDERAFQLLVDRQTADVYRICYQILGSRAEAEKATQEAFAAAHRSLAMFEGTRPAAWLAVIAVRAAWRYWLDRSETGPRSPWPDSWKAAPTKDEDDAAHGDLDPGERAQVRLSLASMPSEQREVITLYFFAGLSLTEIASTTKRLPAAVATELEAGVRLLRVAGAEGTA